MQQFPSYELYHFLVKEGREREIRAAARERQIPRQPSRSARQAVGQSIIRIGEAIAAEPGFKPARSR
jgi:hypothetical protein